MRGRLLKCSSEQVRRATDDEWLGADLIKIIKKDLLADLKVGRTRGFVDVQPEGPPDPDGDQAIDPERDDGNVDVDSAPVPSAEPPAPLTPPAESARPILYKRLMYWLILVGSEM